MADGYLAVVVVNGLKGKYGFVVMGISPVIFFFPIIVVVGAVRVAKPGSWWFRNRYVPKGTEATTALERFFFSSLALVVGDAQRRSVHIWST